MKEKILQESAKRTAYKVYDDLKSYLFSTYYLIPIKELDLIVDSYIGVLKIENDYFLNWLIAYLKEMILNDVDFNELIKS